MEFIFSCPMCYIETELSVTEDEDVIIPEPVFCAFCGHGDPDFEIDDEDDV